jgi:hypothetical protein
LVILGGVAGAGIAAGVTAVGCSGGGSQETPEGGPDGTSDAPHADGPVPDVQVNDVQGDVKDSGVADVDSSAAIPPFLTEVATALCGKLKACCTTVVDSGTFATASCVAAVTQAGYGGTALGAAPLLEAGVLTYDPTAATACLSDIAAIDCTGNVITTQQQIAILTDCTQAVHGTGASGSNCLESIQCATGMFCDMPQDAGTIQPPGTCKPLRSDGGTCGDFGDIPTPACTGGGSSAPCDYGLSEEACSYRRTGNTGLRCNNADPTTGNTVQPISSWTCAPADPVGGGCNQNQDCVSQLCDPGPPGYPFTEPDGSLSPLGTKFTCASSIPFVYLNNCLALTQ